ncbi:MAG: hypothetical protein ACFFA3_05270 [Promethearchaeota archaeon]
MWGLFNYIIPGYDSHISFLPAEEPHLYTIPMFLVGLIPLILIFFGSLALILSANAVRAGRAELKNREKLWIIIGIILVIASIIFIIGINITWINLLESQLGPLPPDYTIWNLYNPGFAVIAPFIGAALSILGSIVSKFIRQRGVIIHTPIFKKQIQRGVITKTPIGQISKKINFCPDCGHQLLYNRSNFCTNCGKSLVDLKVNAKTVEKN